MVRYNSSFLMDPVKTGHKKLKKAIHAYRQVLEGYDREAIHQFRVRMKNLHAYQVLAGNSRNQLPLLVKLDKLFKYTGRIRNWQLQRQRVLQTASQLHLPNPGKYLDQVKAEEEKAKSKVSGLGAGKLRGPWGNIAWNGILSEGYPIGLLQYAEAKKMHLAHLLTLPGLQDDELHDLRKELKEVYYNWKALTWYVPFFLPRFLAGREDLRSFTEQLGTFQDLCMAIRLLKGYVQSTAGEEERPCLEAIHEKWMQEKGEIKTRILCLLYEGGKPKEFQPTAGI